MWSLPLALVGFVMVSWAAADAEVPLRCRDPRCRYVGMLKDDEHQYEVDGGKLSVKYKRFGFLVIDCFGTNASISLAMPRADHALRAWYVVISGCPLPGDGSILDKLNWLNITMLFSEMSCRVNIEGIPNLSLLTAKHFIGLENLEGLSIILDEYNQVTAEHNFLTPLKSLTSLEITRLKLADGELNITSSTIEELILIQTGVKRLPKAVYASSSLLGLTVESDIALDAVAIPPSLQSLELKSPATTLLVNSVPELITMNITNWTEPQPQPLTSCDNLDTIYLTSPAVRTLPHLWLANCSNLKELVIKKALSLNKLPKRMFGGFDCFYYYYLRLFALREGVLESLNEGQFDCDEGRINIHALDLNSNRLRTIPNATLPSYLFKLDLSSNDLDSSVLDKLAKTKCENLNLGDNPRFGDSCDKNGYSPFRHMDFITMLSLYNTNVSRLCRDWREDMPLLEELDLRNTSVTRLTFEDLQFPRTKTVPAKVLLEGAPVTLLEMTSSDMEKAKRGRPSRAFVHLDDKARFQCDCRMYWTRQVLDQFPRALGHISKLQCMNEKFLSESIAAELVCARPEECISAGVPDTCTCSERPDNDLTRDRKVLRVDCTGAALTHMPRLVPTEDRLYELLLAYNQITDVHAKDLDNVTILDLRNNSVKRVDNETAEKLRGIGDMLWLAGNPIDSDCSATPLQLQLHHRNLECTDLKHINGSDGKKLQDVLVEGSVHRPPSIAAYVASLAVLFALAVAVTVCFASRKRRFFAKAVLHRWGCLCCLDVDEDDRRYDAFMTFTHEDEDIAYELMSRLETTYRLCVHHCNWVQGLRIPDQIVESMRESRRTLALVSRHFLASFWARAEFREAREAAMFDARPRLVVILLEDPAALALDEQLQRYIATHTYLRWGDPWFYDKLAVALPRPRQPQYLTDPSRLKPTAGSPVPLRALEQNRSSSHGQTAVEVSIPLMPVVDLQE